MSLNIIALDSVIVAKHDSYNLPLGYNLPLVYTNVSQTYFTLYTFLKNKFLNYQELLNKTIFVCSKVTCMQCFWVSVYI